MCEKGLQSFATMYFIETSTYGAIALREYDTFHYAGPILAGSLAYFADGDFGNVLLQVYEGHKYRIHFFQISCRKKTRLKLPLAAGVLQTLSCTKGKANHYQHKEKLSLHSGQFLFIAPPRKQTALQLEKDQEYHLFAIGYDRPMLEPLVAVFPQIGQALLSPLQLKWPDRTFWTEAHGAWLHHQLLDAYYEPLMRDYLFGEWAEDLLRCMLLETLKQPLKVKQISSADHEKLFLAKQLILENVRSHFTIDELARKVGLNAFKIKEGFRCLFGKGPFAILKDARMQLAYELLLHTDRPEKDIMTEAGYTSLTAFVKAFRSTYGVPPGHLRMKKGKTE